MADAKQCDRCGKYYSEVTSYPVVKLADGHTKQITCVGNNIRDCDLCTDCWNRFGEWWEKR